MDDYSKIPKLYGMEIITTEEVIDKPDMFQSILGKVDGFGWWDMEIIQTDNGTQFTSKDIWESISDVEPTIIHKLATDTNPSVSNLCVLFCPFVVLNTTTHVDTKALNMRHQSQKCFSGIFV